jgi:hypothetical protein
MHPFKAFRAVISVSIAFYKYPTVAAFEILYMPLEFARHNFLCNTKYKKGMNKSTWL